MKAPLKNLAILLSGLVSLLGAGVLHAQEAWLLVGSPDHYELARAAGNQLEDVMSVGDVYAYGQSDRSLAFVRYEPDTDAFQLEVLDKESRRVTATFPIESPLQAHMQGAVQDLVVTPRYVYFATIRLNSAHQIALNSLEGRLDLHQLNLADGTIRIIPLPPACHTARLVDYNGIPLVFAWNGYDIWKVDERTNTLQQLLREQDVPDIIASESRGCDCKSKPGPGPFADDVAIPGAGVFRISRIGELQQVLNANLYPVARPRESVNLGLDLGRYGEFAALSRGTMNGHPAIGVLGVHDGQTYFEYRDPRTLNIMWGTRLPDSAAPLSAGNLGTVPDGILYVDRGEGTIVKATPTGPQVVWDLRQLDPSVDPGNTLVILVHDGPGAVNPGAGS